MSPGSDSLVGRVSIPDTLTQRVSGLVIRRYSKSAHLASPGMGNECHCDSPHLVGGIMGVGDNRSIRVNVKERL